MDIGFRSAFIISAIVHACIAAPFYNHNLIRDDFVKKDSVIVEYIILKEMSNITPANVSDRGSAEIAEAQRSDVKETSTQDIRGIKHDKAYYRKKNAAARSKKDKNSAVNDPSERMGGKALKKQAGKDYINYYGLLKDRIRLRLQKNYRFYKGEGDVYLSFVLNAGGALLIYNIDRPRSSKDEVLLHMARASLVAVAPFPPLPKAISAPETSFNIVISFKKQ